MWRLSKRMGDKSGVGFSGLALVPGFLLIQTNGANEQRRRQQSLPGIPTNTTTLTLMLNITLNRR